MTRTKCIYVSPKTRKPLRVSSTQMEGNDVIEGALLGEGDERYPILGGIPDFVSPDTLSSEQQGARDYYKKSAAVYDDVANLTFRIQNVDETKERKRMVECLHLTGFERVLELACGTGRDSVLIAKRLHGGAEYYLQDISKDMLLKCREKVARTAAAPAFSVGNACALAFPDRYFDAVYSFGGLGVFGDIRQAMREIVRVSKVGARVVVGDESMPPWLYESEYGKILLNNNPLFKLPIPLDKMPVEARDVAVRWVVGGVYYIIEFTVGEGEPKADFDLEIPGRRGGSLRTRYYGRLEGVTKETFELAQKAREKSGKSMHEWLDEAVSEAARKELGHR